MAGGVTEEAERFVAHSTECDVRFHLTYNTNVVISSSTSVSISVSIPPQLHSPRRNCSFLRYIRSPKDSRIISHFFHERKTR